MSKILLLQGNQAVVEGAIAAGVKFFGGYPITPSTEVAESLAERLPLVGGKFIQMEDEIASMGAIIGAALTGKKVMTATSGPGFSLKQELIGYACMAEIPLVIVNVQRVGPSTGQPTSPSQGDLMQARWGTHGDHWMISLTPASVPECFELTLRAYASQRKIPCSRRTADGRSHRPYARKNRTARRLQRDPPGRTQTTRMRPGRLQGLCY
mgnify:CR=1 FL=1